MPSEWEDGRYEDTGAVLLPGAIESVAAAALRPGERVLDVGTGSGNAALQAARAGARVTGLDPAARLLDVARDRLAAEGFELETAAAGVLDMPFDAAAFDAVLAVFSVFFVPDPPAVAEALLRVCRPGGRVVVATWVPEGPVHELHHVLAELDGPASDLRWTHAEGLESLLGGAGRKLRMAEHRLAFGAPSAEAFLYGLETTHPVYRQLRADKGDAWTELRRHALALLERGNESSDAFEIHSRYLVTRVDLEG